jgi:hypothetical protein
MSYTKNALERAAERLRVPVDELTSWLMTGKYRPMPELEYAARDKVSGPVGDAAAILRVHPTDLARWLDARDDLDAAVAAQTAADGQVYGRKPDGTIGWFRPTFASYRVTPAELVGEDDYRGVAADLIARWADDHMDATTVLASLNLAAHGMPVTTPSRRALAKIRERVDHYRTCASGTCGDDLARDLAAILDEAGA